MGQIITVLNDPPRLNKNCLQNDNGNSEQTMFCFCFVLFCFAFIKAERELEMSLLKFTQIFEE